MVIIYKGVKKWKWWNKIRELISRISKKVGIIMKIMGKNTKELTGKKYFDKFKLIFINFNL